MDCRPASPADFPGILAVLERSQAVRLTPEQRAEQGYVQGSFSAEVLSRFSEGPGLVVAVVEGQVVGVCLSTLTVPPQGAPAELARYGDRRWGLGNWVMYGPVAVDPLFRGRGILRPMLRALASLLQDYPVAAGFIDAANLKSLRVHEKLGFVWDGTFAYNRREYHVVRFDPRNHPF